ncbi:hypothetical protein AAF712_013461 [Marasmius tenuissimus]|uniref:Uncharacterized protein n=1 Tax=Marasmius tenuissimus TaxID=585030 RepID=A0ABR2ZFQ5_9AGAR
MSTHKIPEWTSSFSYCPGRLIWVAPQCAVLFCPKTQQNNKRNFALTSPYDQAYDSRKTELFYDNGPENNGNVIYAGTFEYLQLNHLHPEGFHYVGSIPGIDRLCEALVDTQTEGERLRTEDMKDYLKSGVIKLEFVGLRMVGFDANLHAQLTGGSVGVSSSKASSAQQVSKGSSSGAMKAKSCPNVTVPSGAEKDRDLGDDESESDTDSTSDSDSTSDNHSSVKDAATKSTICRKDTLSSKKTTSQPEANSAEDAESDSSGDSSSDSDAPPVKSGTLKRSAAPQPSAVVNKRQRSH